VEVAEQYADGIVGDEDLKAAGGAAWDAVTKAHYFAREGASIGAPYHRSYVSFWAYETAWTAAENHGPMKAPSGPYREAHRVGGAYAAAVVTAGNGAIAAGNAAHAATGSGGAAAEAAERAAQAALARAIFGNPFHPPSAIAPSVLRWNDALVRRLAEQAYEDRLPEGALDNARLVVLADALEEASLTDQDILNHLRDTGPHYRGCWALDHIFGRQ
jgi:hypothetical protein